MSRKITLKKIFSKALGTKGFAHKGTSWFLSGQDAIAVLNLQMSDFDQKYYVNLGLWLKSLGDTEFPMENICHIQTRLTSLFPANIENLERVCRLDSDNRDDIWLEQFLCERVATYCEECLIAEQLRMKILSGDFQSALVMKVAKIALKIPA